MSKVDWKKLGEYDSKGDSYLLVLLNAIAMRVEVEVDGKGKGIIRADEKFCEDIEAVLNDEMLLDCPKGDDCFRKRYQHPAKPLRYYQNGKKESEDINVTALTKTTMFGSNKGSGAGAKETALFESATAWALGWCKVNNSKIKKDYTFPQCDEKSTWDPVKPHVDTTATCEEVMTFLAGDKVWSTAIINTANLLYGSKYWSDDYNFFRGKGIVDVVENHFKKVNKDSDKPFSNVNKWSPADIYLCDCDFDTKEITRHTNFQQMNACMLKLIEAKKLMGVSLKKITSSGSIKEINYGTWQKVQQTFAEITSNTLFDSMDIYFHMGSGAKVQFRSTDKAGSTWQGEVSGVTAKHGKIGGGVLDKILKAVNEKYGLFTNAKYADTKAISKDKKNLGPEIVRLAKANTSAYGKVGGAGEINLKNVNDMSLKWKFSKFMCLVFADIVRQMDKDERDELATAIYAYATSTSDLSGPYIKIS